jgi:hypothetical protein
MCDVVCKLYYTNTLCTIPIAASKNVVVALPTVVVETLLEGAPEYGVPFLMLQGIPVYGDPAVLRLMSPTFTSLKNIGKA